MEIDIQKVLDRYDKQFIEMNRKIILLSLENEELNFRLESYNKAIQDQAKELKELKDE